MAVQWSTCVRSLETEEGGSNPSSSSILRTQPHLPAALPGPSLTPSFPGGWLWGALLELHSLLRLPLPPPMPAPSASHLLGWNAGQIDPEDGRAGASGTAPSYPPLVASLSTKIHTIEPQAPGSGDGMRGRDHRIQGGCLAERSQVHVGTRPPPPHLRLGQYRKAESSVEKTKPTAVGSWLSLSLAG